MLLTVHGRGSQNSLARLRWDRSLLSSCKHTVTLKIERLARLQLSNDAHFCTKRHKIYTGRKCAVRLWITYHSNVT